MKFLIVFAVLVAVAQANMDSGYISKNVEDPIGAVISKIPKNVGKIILSKFKACWKDSDGRGVGRPINACAPDMEKDAGLCYKQCRAGYTGVGPVCWEDCKPSYTNNGAFCGRSGEIISSNNDDCPWYDVCGLTFEKGCSHCPEGYKNDGCTCRIDPSTYTKHSYGRGVGVPMGCAEHEDYDAGLCYDKCETGYDGVGPVCWQDCPRTRSHEFGAMCCKTEEDCDERVQKIAKGTVNAVAAAIEAGLPGGNRTEAVKAAIEAVVGFILPSCTRY